MTDSSQRRKSAISVVGGDPDRALPANWYDPDRARERPCDPRPVGRRIAHSRDENCQLSGGPR